jgi:hypothetical protein
VLLTDFQVHGMRCLPQAIELAGWDTLYTIDLASRRVTTRAERLDPSRREPQNLGYWSRPAVVDLSADDGGRFQLVMNRVSQPIDRGIEHHTVSRLVRREESAGAAGAARIVASVTLFEGVFREPVD